jgi:hypothetical protein
MSPSLDFKDTERERRIFVVRAWLLFLVALLLLGGLALRLVQLQVWEHETYSTRSEQNRIQLQPHRPAARPDLRSQWRPAGQQPARLDAERWCASASPT